MSRTCRRPARLGDLEAVVDRLALERFTINGIAHGSTTAVAYAAKHPERVSRMVLIAPYVRGAEMLSGTPMLRAIKALSEVAEANWEFFTLTLANWLINFANAEAAAKTCDHVPQSNGTARLPETDSGLRGDRRNRYAPRRYRPPPWWSAIRRFSFRFFPSSVNPSPPAYRERSFSPSMTWRNATGTLLDFLRGDQPSPYSLSDPPERSTFRTVLFTDLVGHTEMMSRLGDERGRAVLREHERITREVLKAHGGTEVKTMGDGFMASFGSVTKAVECAIALQRAFAEREASRCTFASALTPASRSRKTAISSARR